MNKLFLIFFFFFGLSSMAAPNCQQVLERAGYRFCYELMPMSSSCARRSIVHSGTKVYSEYNADETSGTLRQCKRRYDAFIHRGRTLCCAG